MENTQAKLLQSRIETLERFCHRMKSELAEYEDLGIDKEKEMMLLGRLQGVLEGIKSNTINIQNPTENLEKWKEELKKNESKDEDREMYEIIEQFFFITKTLVDAGV